MSDPKPLTGLERVLAGFKRGASGIYVPDAIKKPKFVPMPEQTIEIPKLGKPYSMFCEERRKAKLKKRNRKANKRAHKARMVNYGIR